MGNSCHFDGRLGGDAEAFTTQGGSGGARFSIANDVGYGDRKATTWIKCTLWGKKAENLLPYLKKGKRVVVLGEVSLNEWTNRDGMTKTDLQCSAHDVWLMSPREDGDSAGQSRPASGGSRPPAQQARRAPAPAQQNLTAPVDAVSFDDDDIPF